jgi:hypothetical protein
MSHAGQDVPHDSVSIWRYVDLGQFLWLLKSRSLYFARIAEFTDDPWEATLPAPLQERLRPSGVARAQFEAVTYDAARYFETKSAPYHCRRIAGQSAL